jgi:cellulose synthase/poly-beta-1,6-N-acetylglucosamine synthase-like glycosyltransferase
MSLGTIDYPHSLFEVIVTGGNGDEESRNTVTSLSSGFSFDIFYVGGDSSTRSKVLNSACAVARGSVLVFSDDDCLFQPDWLQKIQGVFDREPDAGIVGGEDDLISNGSSFNLALDCTLRSFMGTGGLRRKARFSVGNYYPKLWNMAITSEVARDVAAKRGKSMEIFNESLTVHEDAELAYRIEKSGRGIVFSREIRVGHFRDTTFRNFLRRNIIMARVCRSHGMHTFSHSVLSTFALCAAGLTVSSIFFHFPRVLMIVGGGLYMGMLLLNVVSCLMRTKKLSVAVYVPALMISLHLARGIGYLFPLRSLPTLERT